MCTENIYLVAIGVIHVNRHVKKVTDKIPIGSMSHIIRLILCHNL